MKCALWVLGGCVVVPIAAAIALLILFAPMYVAEEVFKISHVWGGVFWMVVAGGALGAGICIENRR